MILNLILNENEKEIVNDINSMGIGKLISQMKKKFYIKVLKP